MANRGALELIIESKRTHALLSRLHFTVLWLWVLFGLFHYHSTFEERWDGQTLGVLQASSLFQALWGVELVLLVALRNDFPLNLLAICLAFLYFGFTIGVHMKPPPP
ncbi:hypothetical protein BASA81_012804 [Batrachochytrium salamandrivorans]|nr:hypothetical protein BASA81_012804 [Batrachochytrium salamandrivorans]